MDNDGSVRGQVFALDATLQYGMYQVIAEGMIRDGLRPVQVNGVDLGEQDETGFQVSLVADLKDLIQKPVYVFGRFDGWSPGFDRVDDGGELRSVGKARRLTLAAGYDLSEYFRLKLEYYHYLDDSTREPGLSGHGAIAQVTARF